MSLPKKFFGVLVRTLGAFLAISFGRFLESDLSTLISTLFFMCFLCLLICLILIYRMRVSRGKKSSFLFFVILILIFVVCTWVRSVFLFFLLSAGTFIFQVSAGSNNFWHATSLPLPGKRVNSWPIPYLIL